MITEIKDSGLPLEANMKVYIKRNGFNNFYEADTNIRTSNRGYKIVTLTNVKEVSKYEFYKHGSDERFVLPFVEDGLEIHEIGSGFVKRLIEKECA